jgi:hypothetical protein
LGFPFVGLAGHLSFRISFQNRIESPPEGEKKVSRVKPLEETKSGDAIHHQQRKDSV